jgi:uncharacterized phage protein (TIGR01671 family)
MTREIKLRAWDKKNKIMTYDVLNKEPILETVNDGTPQQDSVIVGLKEYSDLELTQYIGLKDQNGEEIYEGDIAKYNSPIDGKRYITTIPSILNFHWYGELNGNEDFLIIGNKFEGIKI